MRHELVESVPPRDLAIRTLDYEMPPDDDPRFASLQRDITETKTALIEAQKETREIRLEMAELKGTILTEIRHLGHDVKNILQAMMVFVPRAEIERGFTALEKKFDEAEAKIKAKADAAALTKLEEGNTWLWRTLIGSTFLGVVSWVGWYVKK